MRKLLLLAVLGVSAFAQGLVTIQSNPIYRAANGNPENGSGVIAWQSFTTATGIVVPAGSINFFVAGGAFTQVIQLYPNVGANPPGTSYAIQYNFSGSPVYTRNWYVPASSTPVAVVSIEFPPSGLVGETAIVSPAQLTQAGATVNQPLCWNGAFWSPGSCGGGGLAPGGGQYSLQYNSGVGSFSGLTSLGTTTTLLHGNPIGPPTFGQVVTSDIAAGAVSLTSQVNGVLPVANGGTGTSTPFTMGSVVFAGSGGTFQQDNSNFFYSNVSRSLGVGPSTSGFVSGLTGSEILANNGGLYFVNSNGTGIVKGITVDSTTSSNVVIGATTNSSSSNIYLNTNGKNGAIQVYGATGDVVICQATPPPGNDHGFSFDVQCSGTSGTARVFNQSSGDTLFTVQASSTQSGPLQAWNTNAGSLIASVTTSGLTVAGNLTISSIAGAGPQCLQISSGVVGTTGTACGSGGGGGTVTNSLGSLTAGHLVVGNGGNDETVLVGLGTTTQVLHGNIGGNPAFSALVLTTDVSGILPFANGGLGTNTNFTNHFFYGNNTGSTAAPQATQPTVGDLAAGTATAVSTFPGGDLFCGGFNAQSGTTYTIQASDECKLVTFNNSGSIAVTLPQATTTGFTSGAFFDVYVIGAGAVTVTPTTSTINGASTVTLNQGQGARIVSNGTNYSAWVSAAPSGSGTVTSITFSSPLTGGTITASGTVGCTTCVTSAASLTNHQLVLGAGSQGTSTLGSLGTTTTVYHGNAAGAGSFGPTVLTTDVSGILPAANLPTASSSALGIVQGDGSTTTINGSGVISVTTATTSQLGAVKPDGTTISISGGVISAAAGSTICADTTHTNTYSCTPSPAPSSLTNLTITLQVTHGNTSAVTVNVNSLGAIPVIFQDGAGFTGGEIQGSPLFYTVYYDNVSSFRMQRPGAVPGSTNCLTGNVGVSPNTIDINTSCLPQLTAANTFSGANIFSGSLGVPNSGTLPATCSVGQSYQYTAASAGSQWYLCTSSNTWTAQGASSTTTHYVYSAAAAINDGSGATLLWQVPNTGSTNYGAPTSNGNSISSSIGAIQYSATTAQNSWSWTPYVMQGTTGNLALTIPSSIIGGGSGSQAYKLYVAFSCATPGTTNMSSSSLTFGGTAYTISHTITDSGTNALVGVVDTTGTLATGCTQGQLTFIQIKRTPQTGGDTATELIVVPWMQISEIY